MLSPVKYHVSNRFSCTPLHSLQDAPMRFFFRVRTSEPCTEEELPEVPLRRSPSISARKTLTPAITSTEASPTTTPITTSSPTASATTPSVTTDLPSSPPNVGPDTTVVASSSSASSSPASALLVKVKSAMNRRNSIASDFGSPKSVSFANSSSSSSKDGKTPKVKTPKSSDDKLAKQAARSAKKLTKDAAAAAAAAAATPTSPAPECAEKRVENIKLKIDQNKNSVTIVKNSTKELKLKFKKEREQKELHQSKMMTSTSSPLSSPSTSSSSSLSPSSRQSSSSKSRKGENNIASIKIAKVQTPERPNSEVKYEIKSPVVETAPALPAIAATPAVKAANVKVAPVLPTPIEINLDTVKTEIDDIEEKKSEFLNSFDLTPTKSLTPIKLQQIDEQRRRNQQLSPKSLDTVKQTAAKRSSPPKHTAEKKSSPPSGKTQSATAKTVSTAATANNVFKVPLPLPVPRSKASVAASEYTDANPLKRKQKDSPKSTPKRTRISSPELPLHSATVTATLASPANLAKSSQSQQQRNIVPTNLPEISITSTTASASSGRKSNAVSPPLTTKRKESLSDIQLAPLPMRPPINELRPITAKDVLPKPPQVPIRNYDNIEKKNLSVKPIDKLMPKPMPVVNNVPRPLQSDTPRPTGSSKSSPPANAQRSPSGSNNKKLPNLLPKPIVSNANNSMPPPMAPPTMPNLLRNTNTEIKQISNDAASKDAKVYSPALDKHPMAIKAPGSSSPAYVPSYASIPAVPLKQNGNTSGYLNFALMNSHKRASADAAAAAALVGNRTPNVYASGPGSSTPSYSPSSPQYTPNYGGSTGQQSQFKYMKTPAHMANMFPHPPGKMAASNTPAPTNANKQMPAAQQQPFKRPAPVSPATKDYSPPEKQQKVQSLLDSCNISFPPSLSITLHEQKDSAPGGSNFQSLHKGPVNNYIEIVKLPDVPLVVDEQHQARKQPSPPQPQTLVPRKPSPPQSPLQQHKQASISVMNFVSVTSSPVATTAATATNTSAGSMMPPPQSVGIVGKSAAASSAQSPTKPRPSPEKKTLPELNPIDKLQALKDRVSFQEKFIKSLDGTKQPTTGSATATSTTKSSSKPKPVPRAIAPKSSISPPNQQQQRANTLPGSSNSTQQTLTAMLSGKSSSSSSTPAAQRKSKSKSPSPPGLSTSPSMSAATLAAVRAAMPPRNNGNRTDLALDLTATPPLHHMHQQHNNNNEQQHSNKRRASNYMSPVSQQQLLQHHQHQQQQQQSAKANNELATALLVAMSRASQAPVGAVGGVSPSPFAMLPPILGTYGQQMQQQIQQQYLLDHFARNLQAGQEACTNYYTKMAQAAAVAAAAAGSSPTAAGSSGKTKTPTSSPKSSASPKSSS